MTPETKGPMIIASEKDPASLNIANNLIAQHSFTKINEDQGLTMYESDNVRLAITEKLGLHTEPEDIPGDPSSIIFASKHVSATGKAALTIHATGNLGDSAKFGGRPKEVSYVSPSTLQQGLKALVEGTVAEKVKIEVTMEATHHGPTSFPIPVCFVEIGSDQEHWADPSLGRIASEAIMEAINYHTEKCTAAVGFGGTHYSEKHTRLNLHSQFSIGHLVPKHILEAGVSNTVLRAVFEKTLDDCMTALVDWKGIKGNNRQALLESLSSMDIEIVRI